LTYFGVLDLGRYLPEKCNLEGKGVFTCEEWKASAADKNLQMTLRNKATKSVDIDTALFEPSDPGYAAGCDNLVLDPPRPSFPARPCSSPSPAIP